MQKYIYTSLYKKLKQPQVHSSDFKHDGWFKIASLLQSYSLPMQVSPLPSVHGRIVASVMELNRVQLTARPDVYLNVVQ